MVLAGTVFALIGTFGARTTTTTTCMGRHVWCGVNSVAWEYISIATAPCTAISKVIGAVSDPTGTCGGKSISSSVQSGCGDGSVGLVGICIACGHFTILMVQNGKRSALTGTCIGETSITIDFMGKLVECGVDTGALDFTSTAIAPFTEITRATGAALDPTGTCGNVIISTSVLAGAWATSVELEDTCTVRRSSSGGMASAGILFANTGISIVATILIMVCTVRSVGLGEVTNVLVCTVTDTAHCIVMSKDTGVGCDHIGISGNEITTSRHRDGSSEEPKGWDVICIV